MEETFLETVKKTEENNFAFLRMIASYLNRFPDLITPDTMAEALPDFRGDKRRTFAFLLANMLVAEEEKIPFFLNEYFDFAVEECHPETYREDPYFKNIKIPEKSKGKWSFGEQTYQPYEGFVVRDITREKSQKEICHIGFFADGFSYPTVFENGVEWMAIKPNEIETMKEPLSKMHGNVCVFGLGLGYFAYLCSQKEEVSSVTIIERSAEIISLFEEELLPQFEHREKIRIVCADAFDFVKENETHFDTAFVDLWHDVSDGIDLYLSMKRLEYLWKGTLFTYWVEPSLLSVVRWRVFDALYEKGCTLSPEQIKTLLNDSSLIWQIQNSQSKKPF